MAKNQGQKRIHHFAHQSGTECDFAYESMLHLLAKEKVRNAFLNNNEFWMSFEYGSYCPQSENAFMYDMGIVGLFNRSHLI